MLIASRPLVVLRSFWPLGLAWAAGLACTVGLAVSAGGPRDTSADPVVERPIARLSPAAGEWLVATDVMPDPTFVGAEILIVHHDADGALGFVLNGERSRQQGIDVAACGPVGSDHAVALHAPSVVLPSTRHVNGRFALSEASEVLQAVRDGVELERLVVCAGYAGWGPGQLEAELAEGGWRVSPSVQS